ncbi:MAG: HAD family hydrolase [bacterium]
MKKLLLFDIDGTLLTGAGVERFKRSINNLHNLEIKSDRDFNGYTDFLILAALLEDEGWDKKQIEEAMPELMRELDRVHAETFHAENITLLPGVTDLLVTLKSKNITLGLITGNLRTVAERKLKALGIWDYFTEGGFGSDPHTVRADLVRLAVKQAGFKNDLDNVFVIGDTPRDIQAATEAGIKNSVGVANGFRDIKELSDAGAKFVFEDLVNTDAVLRNLQLI